MNTDTFRHILNIIPETVTQIQFGVTDTIPQIFTMSKVAWEQRKIVCNYTTHGLDITPEIAQLTAKHCGVVGISVTPNVSHVQEVIDRELQIKYNAVKQFADANVKQINLHFVLMQETYDEALQLIRAVKNDPRLANIYAILFLGYKPKGTHTPFHPLDQDRFKIIVTECFQNNIRFGMDSCNAPRFIKSIENDTNKKLILTMVEPCESGLFSLYINYKGQIYPCSFTEEIYATKTIDYETTRIDTRMKSGGINVYEVNNQTEFIDKIWMDIDMMNWRNLLLNETKDACNNKCEFSTICRTCPVYDITPCRPQTIKYTED